MDRYITENMRIMLKRRRLELGLSYNDVAEALSVSWCAVRYWEIGKTKKCHPVVARKLSMFLNGGMDCVLRQKNAIAADGKIKLERVRPIMELIGENILFEKIARLYDLCKDSPAIRAKLLAAVCKAACDALAAYAENA